jgi:GrpB-like predicted nucleotidyltransferase (UPF0157 family)
VKQSGRLLQLLVDHFAIPETLPNPLIIEDYDPRWPQLFEQLRSRIAVVLKEVAVSREHVGSTPAEAQNSSVLAC